jgi:hypothetical protein
MRYIGRAILLVAIALMAAMDVWLSTLRCASSPAVDWPRLSFGLAMQVAVLAASLVLARVQQDLARSTVWQFSVGLLAAAAFTFVLVRQPLLLSDTTYDKFYPSGSYKCLGVPSPWKRGG